MNKNSIYGWKNVFTFTFKEEFKQKSYRIALAIFFILALASMPVKNIVNNKSDGEKHATEVRLLTVYDETGLNIDYKSFS